MEVSYILDMHTNYLIIESDKDGAKSYIAKMILNNRIEGLLNVELRCIDDKDYFYYNITSTDSLWNIYERKLLGYTTLKNVLIKIIETLERSREFLLNEDGFILKPYFIYLDKDESTPLLCYYVNYSKPLLSQFCRLIEYFMDKVDYKDERAVLLVYALYKISKETNVTLDQIKDELFKDLIDVDLSNTYKEAKDDKDRIPTKLNIQEHANLPPNKDYKTNPTSNYITDKTYYSRKASDEKEVLVYSKMTYIITAISMIVILVLFIIMFQSKLLYNNFGTKIDLIKLLCFVVVIGCGEALLLSNLFIEDKKVVKIIPSIREVANNLEDEKADSNSKYLLKESLEPYEEDQIKNCDTYENYEKEDIFTTQVIQRDGPLDEEDDFSTEILFNFTNRINNYFLESTNPEIENIYINRSPFIVGKNLKGVDHRINDNSVSRFHARLSIDDDAVSVTDLGSLNGTYINDSKIKEHMLYNLDINDELSFSKCKFIVKKS